MKRAFIAFVVLAACGGSGETTPAGLTKAVDLRSRISKPDVAARAPTDDKAQKFEYAVDVQGIKAKVVWRAWEDASAKYILSAGWEVVTPKQGFTLEPLGTLNPENVGTVEAPVQSEIIRVRWHDNTSSGKHYGEMSVKIDATGRALVI